MKKLANSLSNDFVKTCKNPKSVKEYSIIEETNCKYRPYMEDKFSCIDQYGGFSKQAYFGIFDGHGGKEVSEYCAERLHENLIKIMKEQNWRSVEGCIEESFYKIDSEVRLLDSDNMGTTACIVLITYENKERIAYVANVGDTRAVLASLNSVERLSYDDKASDLAESERVKKAGGVVFMDRVGGQLAITRSIGDHSLKEFGVISNPHIIRRVIKPLDKWIIIATDGLWDCVNDSEITSIIGKEESSEVISKNLLKNALQNGSKDNITILVVKL